MANFADPCFKRARRSRIYAALAATVTIGGTILCLSGMPALAATTSTTCNLYASTSGSDGNPGTASAPFATVKHLLEELSAGQTGCLASGQTFAGFTLYEGDTHGVEGEPLTLTSTNPEVPATIDGRVVTETGANWLTFTHLNFVYGADTLYPGIGIGSAHTSWTYDNVSGGDLNICFETNPVNDAYGGGEYTLIEHDRVYDCGHPVTEAELEAQASNVYEGRENGWHTHGLYNEGLGTTVKNSYFYDASGNGILLRAGADAVIEHNVIDSNGRGVEFGNEAPEHSTVAWNIITNSTSPCGEEIGNAYHCDSFGVQSSGEMGTGNIFEDNDVYGDEGGNIGPSGDLCSCIERSASIEVNPLYTNAAAHEYTLDKGSPAAGYGPDTAQPQPTSATPGETTLDQPAGETPTILPISEKIPTSTPSKGEAIQDPPVSGKVPTSSPARKQDHHHVSKDYHHSSTRGRNIGVAARSRPRGVRHPSSKPTKRRRS